MVLLHTEGSGCSTFLNLFDWEQGSYSLNLAVAGASVGGQEMSQSVMVSTLQTEWIAHVQNVLAGYEVVDARARRNAEVVRSLVGSQAACCCDTVSVNHATQIYVPVSSAGDTQRRLFELEPAFFGSWRVESPFTPFLEILEVPAVLLPVSKPLSLDALDVIFGRGVEIVVVPRSKHFSAHEGGDESSWRRFIRRYVARRAWEAIGPRFSLRLTIPNGERPPFDDESLLRQRLVPLWVGDDSAPQWIRTELYEATPRELSQLQI